MKKLLVLLMVSSTLALHGAGCAGCAERRAKMMANRPTAAKAFRKYLEEISELDHLLDQFENGDYKTFLEGQHTAYLKELNNTAHKNLLVHRKNLYKTSRFYFGRPSLDYFVDFPSSILELQLERGEKFISLLEENTETFFEPLLTCLGTFKISEAQSTALQTLSSLRNMPQENTSELEKALIEIDEEFFVTQLLFNGSYMREKSIDLNEAAKLVTILDLEMVRQMHQACVDAHNQELANQFEVIQSMIIPMSKVLRWEKFLQMLASECYKLPGKHEKNVVEIQKQYMQQKSRLIRQNRELVLYR